MAKFKIIGGSITSPQGFQAAARFCNLKKIGTGKGSNKGLTTSCLAIFLFVVLFVVMVIVIAWAQARGATREKKKILL